MTPYNYLLAALTLFRFSRKEERTADGDTFRRMENGMRIVQFVGLMENSVLAVRPLQG